MDRKSALKVLNKLREGMFVLVDGESAKITDLSLGEEIDDNNNVIGYTPVMSIRSDAMEAIDIQAGELPYIDSELAYLDGNWIYTKTNTIVDELKIDWMGIIQNSVYKENKKEKQ